MDALQALHTRRSIRHYRNEPVPDELIQQLLSAEQPASRDRYRADRVHRNRW